MGHVDTRAQPLPRVPLVPPGPCGISDFDNAASLAAALARYDTMRRARAANVQRAARANGRTYHLSRPFSHARDAVMRAIGPNGMARRYDWLYGWKPPLN